MGEAIYTSTFLLRLTLRLEIINSWPFTNFDRVSTYCADVGVVKPAAYHQPIVTEIPLGLHNSDSKLTPRKSYPKYVTDDCSLLCNLL
jgi:hypothetical protein